MYETLEFRWLVKTYGEPHFAKERILQTRKAIVTPKKNPREWMAITPEDFDVRYTEWTDVPTVVEENP